MAACDKGNVDLVELIMNHGANVNMQDNDGWSALLLASRYGHGDVVKKLLDNGAEVNIRNNNKSSPLMLACRNGYSFVAQVLINKGAEVNMKNNDNWSSLMLASHNGHIDTVKVLLANHADVNIQNKDGSTALGIVRKKGHNTIVEDLLEAAEQDISERPSPHQSPVLSTIIHSIGQTDEHVTTQDHNTVGMKELPPLRRIRTPHSVHTSEISNKFLKEFGSIIG